MEPIKYDMSVPQSGEELIYVQQRLMAEIDDLTKEHERLLNLAEETEELCDINDAAWVIEEKERLVELLKQLNPPETEIPPTKPEQYLMVLQVIKNQQLKKIELANVLQNLIDNWEKKIENRETLLSVINENVATMEEEDPAQDAEKWNMQTKKDFKTYRAYMHLILDKYFSNGNMKNLLQDLTEAYFSEEGDQYIDLTNGYSLGDIGFLKRASLIVSHPDDNTKIKFIDMY